MKQVLPSLQRWPLHDALATRRIEQTAQRQLPPQALMRHAGAAVARLALALAPHARSILVVAGGGNNGGDGIEAARGLHLAGKRVELLLSGDAQRAPADAAACLAAAREAGVAMRPAPERLPRDTGCDLLVDALLGIGARRGMAPALAARIAEINAHPAPCLAVDLPSGLDGETGQPLDGACVRAVATLALLTLKPGLFTGIGRDACGDIWFDPLLGDDGSAATPPSAWLLGPPAAAFGRRAHASHKGSFGDAGVIGGAAGMAGAALLAARAALAAGAGRVLVDLLGESGLALDPGRPELMLRPGLGGDAALLGRMTAVVGCGGGDRIAQALPTIMAEVPRLVLDADGLNAVAADGALHRQLRERADRGQASVLTPHPLEAARLLGIDSGRVQADRLAAARRLADRAGCTVLLKGSGSIVCAPGGEPAINPTGNASLASAGTGDVLAGWLGGLWSSAAGGGGDPAQAATVAAEAAAWMHGHAADTAGRAVMRADDLIGQLAQRR